eukprot:SAG11_NODE_3555_length_2375_cov_1.669156_2_plen_84_part_00
MHGGHLQQARLVSHDRLLMLRNRLRASCFHRRQFRLPLHMQRLCHVAALRALQSPTPEEHRALARSALRQGLEWLSGTFSRAT